MRIRFLGGVRTVTGSMHLVETARSKVLIDCGLFQGHREEADRINRAVPRLAVEADFMILTHSHVDHCGNIPNLVRSGFAHEIYQTPASRDLTALLLEDSAHIQESDVKFVNKKRARVGQPPKEPLYTVDDARASLKYLTGLPYEQRLERGDIGFTLHDAGHVLGSAQIELEAEGMKIVFTGDLGRKNLPIIRDPVRLKETDYLVIESTYGGRRHPPFAEATAALGEVVNRALKRGGRIVIPAFALERTQEIVYTLHILLDAGVIPEIPIYVDSPLATRITEVFRQHPDCYDQETQDLLLSHEDAFRLGQVKFIESQADSMKLNTISTPSIIISASGMAESGRILHHLRHAIGDPRNIIGIVGFAAEHTLARRLADREPVVRIFGEEYVRRAEVEVIDAFSAHADQNGLLDHIQCFNRSRLKKVFLVHGELEQSEALQKLLQKQGYDAVVPAKGEKFDLMPGVAVDRAYGR